MTAVLEESKTTKKPYAAMLTIDGELTVYSGDTDLSAATIARQLVMSVQSSCASQIGVEVVVG